MFSFLRPEVRKKVEEIMIIANLLGYEVDSFDMDLNQERQLKLAFHRQKESPDFVIMFMYSVRGLSSIRFMVLHDMVQDKELFAKNNIDLSLSFEKDKYSIFQVEDKDCFLFFLNILIYFIK